MALFFLFFFSKIYKKKGRKSWRDYDSMPALWIMSELCFPFFFIRYYTLFHRRRRWTLTPPFFTLLSLVSIARVIAAFIVVDAIQDNRQSFLAPSSFLDVSGMTWATRGSSCNYWVENCTANRQRVHHSHAETMVNGATAAKQTCRGERIDSKKKWYSSTIASVRKHLRRNATIRTNLDWDARVHGRAWTFSAHHWASTSSWQRFKG